MQSSLVSGVCLLGVAFLWGATNPLIKKGTIGVENIKRNSVVAQFFGEITFLVLNWKYVIPFLLNQCGSVLYFITLQHSDLSLAVPIANSLTFVFTWIVGRALGEEPADKRTVFGMALIILGTSLCFIDKVYFGKDIS